MLALSTPVARPYHAFAHIGVATMARCEGRALEGLASLRTAREILTQYEPGYGIVAIGWRKLHEETSRCWSALGLVELAVAEAEQLTPFLAGASPGERHTAAVLGIDLALAQGRWSLALRRAEAALGDAEVRDADVHADLAFRRLLAARRSAATPAPLAEVARGFEALLAGTGLEPKLRTSARVHAAEAWITNGDLERAREHVRELTSSRLSAEHEEFEAHGLDARIELLRGAGEEELSAAQRKLAEAFARMCANLRRAPIRAGGTGPFHFLTRRDALATLLSIDRAAQPGPEGIAAAFAHCEEAASLGTLARRLGAEPPSLARVQAELVPDGGGVLAYCFGTERGHLFAIERGAVEHVEIATGERFAADVDAVRSAVGRMPEDPGASLRDLRTRTDRLAADLLPEPIRARVLRWRHVLLVGDEGKGGAVWQVLPFDGGWLSTVRPLTHVSSAALALRLRQRARERAEPAGGAARLDLAVIGDATGDAASVRRWRLEPLALRAEQRDRLRGGFGKERHRTFFGAEATEGAFADPAAASARILCVLAHGVQDVERERFAGLLLAPQAGGDGVLFADEVERLRVPSLCVLGACSASAGPLRRGDDGASHLGGAFLLAGADTVVLANGDLPLAATVDLLAAMLAELQQGASTAEALRRARAAIAATPGREHPWFFAGLRVVGIDGQPLPPR